MAGGVPETPRGAEKWDATRMDQFRKDLTAEVEKSLNNPTLPPDMKNQLRTLFTDATGAVDVSVFMTHLRSYGSDDNEWKRLQMDYPVFKLINLPGFNLPSLAKSAFQQRPTFLREIDQRLSEKFKDSYSEGEVFNEKQKKINAAKKFNAELLDVIARGNKIPSPSYLRKEYREFSSITDVVPDLRENFMIVSVMGIKEALLKQDLEKAQAYLAFAEEVKGGTQDFSPKVKTLFDKARDEALEQADDISNNSAARITCDQLRAKNQVAMATPFCDTAYNNAETYANFGNDLEKNLYTSTLTSKYATFMKDLKRAFNK